MTPPRVSWWRAITPLGWLAIVLALLGLWLAVGLLWGVLGAETVRAPLPGPRWRPAPVRGLVVLEGLEAGCFVERSTVIHT